MHVTLQNMAEDVGALEMPNSTRRDIAAVNGSLATSIVLWLKKHGKNVRPKLSNEQKQQLHECFELMVCLHMHCSCLIRLLTLI